MGIWNWIVIRIGACWLSCVLASAAVGETHVVSSNTREKRTSPPPTVRASDADVYIAAVKKYADLVLKNGRDVYGPEHTPLFVDGLNVETLEPAVWEIPDDFARVWKMPKRWVMGNVASDQALFRTLDSLSTLTGDARYRQAVLDVFRYTFDHLQHHDGLLVWGGHATMDLDSGRPVGESHKDWKLDVPLPAYWELGPVHELKMHFPYYELMWQADAKATRRFIEAFWNAHIQNWSNLDMNRHATYGPPKPFGWDHVYEGGPLPFQGKGFSVLHTGIDLIFSAALLSEFTGEPAPLEWAKRMAERYDGIRHPTTGLAPDSYSYYHNERVLAQFEPEFGQRLTEMTIASIYGARYAQPQACLLKLSERLGEKGKVFRDLAMHDLTAFATHAYDFDRHVFRAMLTDGTPLSPAIVKRPGTLNGDAFGGRGAGGAQLLAYTVAARLTDDPLMWRMVGSIGEAMDLGRLGPRGQAGKPNLQTACANVDALFALFELRRATGDDAYLEAANRIGHNLLALQVDGYFLPRRDALYCGFDTSAPLALLHLARELRGGHEKLADYWSGIAFFHCTWRDRSRTYDGEVIYTQRRTATPSSQPARQRAAS